MPLSSSQAATVAEVLTEALPYIRRFQDKTIVSRKIWW